MATFVPRLVLIASAVFLGAFQIRYSIATLEARNTFLFIPFQLKPYTNIIESVAQSAKDILHRGDEVIAVNDRPFTGASVYRQELRAARRYLDAVNLVPPRDAAEAVSKWPFRVTIQSAAANVRTVNVYFANCTCGSLDTPQVIWYCILPPAICIMLGLVVAVFSGLQSALPWLFLAVAVCLSLVPIVPEWSSSWSQVADPLEWRDWLRIPALADQSFFGASWPAWLLLFAVYCLRRDASLTAWWAVTPILAVAGLKTVGAIASSESFRVGWPIHRALELASTGTPEVVGVSFTAVLLVIVAAGWQMAARAEPKRRSGSGLLAILSMVPLLVPFMYWALSGVVALWWMRFVPQGVVISLYAGLLGAAWVVFSACRPQPSSESRDGLRLKLL